MTIPLSVTRRATLPVSDAARICFLAAAGDWPAFGGEANRVGQQVDQDLPRVRLDPHEIGCHVVDHYLVLGIRVNGGKADGFFDW